jgi:hypothetical protein
MSEPVQIPYAFVVITPDHYSVYLRRTEHGTYDVLYATFDPSKHATEVDAIKEANPSRPWLLNVQYRINDVRLIMSPGHDLDALSGFGYDYFGIQLNRHELTNRLSDAAMLLLGTLQMSGAQVAQIPVVF